jgi:hypothetical protein
MSFFFFLFFLFLSLFKIKIGKKKCVKRETFHHILDFMRALNVRDILGILLSLSLVRTS